MNAEVRATKTAAEVGLAEAFAAAKSRLPGGKAVAGRRAAAFGRFDEMGLPHRRIEEWKYTDLRALMRDAKPLAGLPDAATKRHAGQAGGLLATIGARRLVLADGAFVPELSDVTALEPGLAIIPMAKALADNDPLIARLGTSVSTDDVAVALNTAFMGDGVVIRVAKGAAIDRPIHVACASAGETASSMFARSLLVVEDGAKLTIVESYEGADEVDYQVNSALEVMVGEGAHVDHVKILTEGSKALHLSTTMAALGARAKYRDLTFTTGGAVVRSQVFLRFGGEGASAAINSATLIKDRQHVDTTLLIDHAVGGGTSRELNKSVLDGQSHGVFQGKIIVRPGAQKTDGRMMSRGLLLSETAEADNKPELEIFADDVQCGHGATAGALDDDLLFYLKARGIPRKEAEALLIRAFVGEVIDVIDHEGLKEALNAAAASWLDARA